MITATPETAYFGPETAARGIILNRDLEFRPSVKEYTDRQAFVNSVFEENKDKYGLAFVHPHEGMCSDKYCAVFDGDIPLYRDTHHITQTYALKLSYLFDPIFQAMAHKQELPPRDAHN